MPTADRKPRRRRHHVAELAFETIHDAYGACDAAQGLPERQRELRPALRRLILQTWVAPVVDRDAWVERVATVHFFRPSPFRVGRPPRGHEGGPTE